MREYRIIFIKGDWLGLRDLDSRHRCGLRVKDVRRFVPGEIVRFGQSPPVEPCIPQPVVSSRIDPGYAPSPWPELATYSMPGHDPEFAPYFALVQAVPDFVEDDFYRRAVLSAHAKTASRSRISGGIIEKYPLYIDPHQFLGEIKWRRGERVKAGKYLETGWKIARLAFHPGFDGTFDWRNGRNLPVFEVGTAYAKVLAHFGREDEALAILEFLHRIDRPGHWSADGIYTPILLRAGRLDRVREIVDVDGPPGPGHFIRALLQFAEGRDEEAVRSVVRGAMWNPLFLDHLLEQRGKRPAVPLREGRKRCAYLAALHTSLTLPEWRRRGLLPRLEAVRRIQPFSDALDRAADLAHQSDLHAGTALDRLPQEGLEDCFTDSVVEATVRAGARG